MAYPNCQPCEERRRKLREALIQARISEALRQAALGAVEILGLKDKLDE